MHKLFELGLPIDVLIVVVLQLRHDFSCSCCGRGRCLGFDRLFPFRGILGMLRFMRALLSMGHHGRQVACTSLGTLRGRRWRVREIHLVGVLLSETSCGLLLGLAIVHAHGARRDDHSSHSIIHITTSLSRLRSKLVSLGEYVAEHSCLLGYGAIAASGTDVTIGVNNTKEII